MSLTVTLNDELWLWRDVIEDKWILSQPWVFADGKPARGMVKSQPGNFKPLPAGTEIDLDVWVTGCAGCGAIRSALRDGHAQILHVEHSHGRIA